MVSYTTQIPLICHLQAFVLQGCRPPQGTSNGKSAQVLCGCISRLHGHHHPKQLLETPNAISSFYTIKVSLTKQILVHLQQC